MAFRVHLVVDAEVDLFEIHRYVARHDSPAQADRLLDRLQETCVSLAIDEDVFVHAILDGRHLLR